MVRRCPSSSNWISERVFRPLLSMKIRSGPLTMISVMVLSRRSGSSGPNPSRSSQMAVMSDSLAPASSCSRFCFSLDSRTSRAASFTSGGEGMALTNRIPVSTRTSRFKSLSMAIANSVHHGNPTRCGISNYFGVKTVNFQSMLPGGFQKSWFVARENMVADYFPIFSHAFMLENVEVLQLIFPVLQRQNFGDGRDFSRAVVQPGGLKNNVYRRGHLFAQR